MIDHEAVLNMWKDHMTSYEIAGELGLQGAHTVRVIVQRARKAGDPRAAPRGPKPGKTTDEQIVVVLKGFSLVPGLRAEAERQNVSIATLVNGLLEQIVVDNLFDAVLDDAHR